MNPILLDDIDRLYAEVARKPAALVQAAFRQAGGNRRKAARILGFRYSAAFTLACHTYGISPYTGEIVDHDKYCQDPERLQRRRLCPLQEEGAAVP